MYIITAKRMISGEVRKYRKGLRLVMAGRYETALPGSSTIPLTPPAQRFLTAHDQINTVFRPRRYQLSAVSYRCARTDAFDLWNGYIAEMNV